MSMDFSELWYGSILDFYLIEWVMQGGENYLILKSLEFWHASEAAEWCPENVMFERETVYRKISKHTKISFNMPRPFKIFRLVGVVLDEEACVAGFALGTARNTTHQTCHMFRNKRHHTYWFMAFKCIVASSSDWPPDKNTIPGTAVGTVRWRAVTVARPTTSGGDFGVAGLTRGHHVGFQEGSLQENVVILQSLKKILIKHQIERVPCRRRQGQFPGDLLTTYDIMSAVRYDTVGLAYGRVSGQDVCVFLESLERGCVFADLQHATPLGKVTAILLVLCATFTQFLIHTLCCTFVVASKQRHNTSIHLDTGNDTPLFQKFDECCAIVGLLVQGFMKQNDTGDVVSNRWASTEEKLPKTF
ncbi:hypothetical protein NQ317_002656 [Molorchus minor]|uniref:Uncharacterized protein n=1 Tax=Molorchus minor TaxID=1323400 RepID=A0ABQ9JKY9_9CUCU|nr:hypothetical protein NQ317_002656 [Molorchus minor]